MDHHCLPVLDGNKYTSTNDIQCVTRYSGETALVSDMWYLLLDKAPCY